MIKTSKATLHFWDNNAGMAKLNYNGLVCLIPVYSPNGAAIDLKDGQIVAINYIEDIHVTESMEVIEYPNFGNINIGLTRALHKNNVA